MGSQVKSEVKLHYSIVPIHCADCQGPTFCYQCWNPAVSGQREQWATVCVIFTIRDVTYDRFHLCDSHSKEWQQFNEADKERIASAMQSKMRTYLKEATQ